MRVVAVVIGLAGCGRIGFSERSVGVADDAKLDSPPIVDGWSGLVAADQTTCAVYRGRAYCWGRGTNNEIGNGVAVNQARPTEVALPQGQVTALTQGEGHGCAIVDAAAYCWGNAPPGTGVPTSTLPVAVTALPAPVTSISAGGGFTCAVAAGATYCWGSDNAGSLGNGAGGSTMTPGLVSLPAATTSVDAANDHVVALLADGSVWSWGHNDSGALGTGSMSPAQVDAPVMTLVSGVQPVFAGWHACANVGGRAQCWGLGTFGELGDGLSTSSASPVNVSGMTSGVETIMTGGGPIDRDASCAVVAGAAWCWGAGIYGRLGQGANSNEPVPVPVQGVPAEVVELALGYGHSCARNRDGSVRCWGRGELGQLGDGNTTTSMMPVVVPFP